MTPLNKKTLLDQINQLLINDAHMFKKTAGHVRLFGKETKNVLKQCEMFIESIPDQEETDIIVKDETP